MAHSLYSNRRLRPLAMVGLLLVLALAPARFSGWLTSPLGALAQAVVAPLAHGFHWVGGRLGTPVDRSSAVMGLPTAINAQPLTAKVLVENPAGSGRYQQRSVTIPPGATILNPQQMALLQDKLLGQDGEVLRLQLRIKELEVLVREFQDLRSQFANQPVVFKQAAIVGGGGDALGNLLTINRGSFEGIAEQSPVVAGPHLVGRVVKVERLSSAIAPITARGNRIDAVVVSATADLSAISSKSQAQFDGTGGGLLVSEVPKSLVVKVGDLARLYDEAWPAGVQGKLLGQVIAIEVNAGNPLWKRVVVKPQVDMRYLREVTVVQARPGAGEGGR